MKRFVVCLALALAGCSSSEPTPDADVTLRLVRQPARRFALEMTGSSVAALQVRLSVDGGTADFQDVRPGEGQGFDQARVGALGASSAMVFAGDTRGVEVAAGTVASLAIDGTGTLRIEEAVASDGQGNALNVELGPSLVLP